MEDCTCEFSPLSLIHIDNDVQHAVRMLNEKKYITLDCCQGHEVYDSTYISFYSYIVPKEVFNTIGVPEGFVFEQDKRKSMNVIRYYYESKDKESWIKEHETAIKNLNNWVDNIPTKGR